MPTKTQERVHDLLHQMPVDGRAAVKRLFCTELNYDHADVPLSTRDWPDRAREVVGEPPTILAQHDSQFGAFHVIHTRLSPDWPGRNFPLSLTAERLVVNQLLKDHPYALFVFSDPEGQHWHLVNVRYDEEVSRRRVFRRIAVGPHERLRTAAERVAMLDLATLSPDLFGLSPIAIQQRHDEAFDVEAVTRRFFTDYRRIFEDTERQIQGLHGEDLRLFTQLLFNRLLFITFLERKGWLTLEGRGDYLCALWQAYQEVVTTGEGDADFYRDRLTLLFFSGLNNPQSADLMRINQGGFLADRIGQVPYLNGGLFEQQALDVREGVAVPDEVFGPIFDDLVYHYNFTVTESTPLDIEVAVDPEMLGRIFEELVTGRHETGSYYTPKPVVSFMCREALKGYLRDTCPREGAGAITAFVDRREAVGIREPEAVLGALQGARCCDPACGSGAYLVGMLHELVELRQALFVARGVDSRAVYDRKLEVIQRNLYGVDLDPFAVNIARLRLWLSLIVDFETDAPRPQPPPLPNLEFKIEVGDSLTGPAPGQLQPDLFHHQQVERYFRLKGQFLTAHGPEKADLRRQIEDVQAEIAEWASEGESDGFDWAVQFAEVFAGPGWDTSTLTGAMTGLVNTAPGQMELAARSGPAAGFDVVLTNPPYVRMELIKELKPDFEERYPEVYAGRADLYVYFYARALHLLREGGVGSFISSNKWLRARYGKKLRQLMAGETTVEAIVDFGDLPLFEATAYPMIVVFQNRPPDQAHALRALEVEDLAVVDRLSEVMGEAAWDQPQASLRPSVWSLVPPEVQGLMKKLRRSGIPLGEYIGGQIYYGIKTGYNKAFVIDRATRDRLVAQDSKSAEIIRPWLRGRDVKQWRVEYSDQYVVFTYRGVDIDKYPAVKAYLEPMRERLEQRATSHLHPWYELQQPQTGIYPEFGKPKIVWPDIASRPAFAFEDGGMFLDCTLFTIPVKDHYLLGLLNSRVSEFFYLHISSMIQQDFIRFKTQYVRQIPIPQPLNAHREAIEALVRKLLDAEGQGPQVEAWERELNVLVYQVYGLKEEEIAIVEAETTADGGNTR